MKDRRCTRWSPESVACSEHRSSTSSQPKRAKKHVVRKIHAFASTTKPQLETMVVNNVNNDDDDRPVIIIGCEIKKKKRRLETGDSIF